MSRIIKIPIEGSQIFDMRKSRGYISIRNKKMKFYHKFRSEKAYLKWVMSGDIEFAWGDTLFMILYKK